MIPRIFSAQAIYRNTHHVIHSRLSPVVVVFVEPEIAELEKEFNMIGLEQERENAMLGEEDIFEHALPEGQIDYQGRGSILGPAPYRKSSAAKDMAKLPDIINEEEEHRREELVEEEQKEEESTLSLALTSKATSAKDTPNDGTKHEQDGSLDCGVSLDALEFALE